MRNPQRSIVLLWSIVAGMIVVRSLRESQDMPPPSAFVGTGVLFGIAALLSELSPPLGVLAAAGWTLSVAYRTFDPTEGGTPPAAQTGASSDPAPKNVRRRRPKESGGTPRRPARRATQPKGPGPRTSTEPPAARNRLRTSRKGTR